MKFSQLGDIAVAWYRSFRPTPEQQALALRRLSICTTCEFMDSTTIGWVKCAACGCPIHKKIFSPTGNDKCPKGKWTE